MKIFISSVQKEFVSERKALAEYLSGDPLLRRFFETFLFERDVPASDRRPDAVYLDEVRNSDLYLGWNPGSLPPPLTPESLRGPHASVPHNPLLAEPMYLTKYIERMGTGIRDMIRRCVRAGLPEPDIRLDAGSFVLTIRRKAPAGRHQITGSVTAPVAAPVAATVTAPVTATVGDFVFRFLALLVDRGALSNSDILDAFGLKSRRRLRETYIDPALADGLVERTIPEKPTSRLQKYRLTDKGRAMLELLAKKVGSS